MTNSKEPVITKAEAISLEDAREVLAQDQQANLELCRREIDAVLEKRNCRLEATMLLRAGKIISRVNVVAND